MPPICFFDQAAQVVALDGLGDALVNQGFGVGLFDIGAFAGGFAEVGVFELDEHGWFLGLDAVSDTFSLSPAPCG